MKVTPSKIFLISSIAFIIGIGSISYLSVGIDIKYGIIAGVILAALLSIKFKVMRVIVFAGLALLLGIWRMEVAVTREGEFVTDYFEEEAVIAGRIVEDVDSRSNHRKITLDNLIIRNEDGDREVGGRLLLNVAKFPTYKYGDAIEFEGEIQEPIEFEDFSYKNYLSRYGIFAVTYYPRDVRLLERLDSWTLKRILLVVKNKFEETINKMLPEPHASFLAGLILGAKRGIPDALMEHFNTTGTTHIVAISGYNITIISAFIMKVLQGRVRRQAAFVISVSLIFLFVILTGAQASVIRAAIMGTIVLIALNAGRLNSITNSLLLSAVIMLLINPKILTLDIGFQLSFLATMGLVYVSPYLEKIFIWIPNALEIRQSLVMTLSAQVMALPIIVFNFDRLSLIAPLANILILWVIPYTMATGFVAGVIGMASLAVGQAISSVSWLFLEWQIMVVTWLAEVPLASIDIPETKIEYLIIYYLGLGIGLYIIASYLGRRRMRALISAS